MADSSQTAGPQRAVFLSYAREDTAAANRIAEALRSHGVEVWFDQNELRGGDAWDQKIRKQIDACTLFIPVISRHTEERGKGYFRLEWKLAVEQTHLLLEGVPFIVPVVVDDTPDSAAAVPAEFRRVQWTRMPGALPSQQFVDRVKLLLEGPAKAGDSGGAARPVQADRPNASPAKSGFPWWAWGVAAGIAIAASAYVLVSRRPEAPAAEVKAPVPAGVPTQAAPRRDDKSIAVLPFDNMSDDKDNAFFTDGIQEDILTNLALVREIRVVSRTSVLQYRDTKKPIGQIASELGVTYVLEGSVRRAGNKVRVTGQLIHAATDEHVWAKAYDRDLTDIFAIQSELAQDIAAELKAALSPEEKAMLERRPTENTIAYDPYLRARNKDDTRTEEAEEKKALLLKAVGLDPSFARAWGELARAYAYGAFHFQEGTDDLVAKAKDAIDRAVQLAPEDPDVFGMQGDYYYYAYRDYVRANAQYQRLAQQRPNDAGVFSSLGLIQRRQGRWAESLANLRRAAELDVANTSYLKNLIASLLAARRYDELAAARRRMAALKPDDLDAAYSVAFTSFQASGSTKQVEEFLANLTPAEADSTEGIDIRADWAGDIGDYAEVVRLKRLHPYSELSSLRHWEQDVWNARILYLEGDKAAALARLGNIPDEMAKRREREPKNPRIRIFDAMVELIQGRAADAVRSTARSVELIPESLDALESPAYASLGAKNDDYAGDKDRALAEYARILRDPGGFLNVYELRRDTHSKLQGDPRFEALLNDPANNAPLF
jgi:TolB-like protein/tetratricopeptide (TPR) repeat protein